MTKILLRDRPDPIIHHYGSLVMKNPSKEDVINEIDNLLKIKEFRYLEVILPRRSGKTAIAASLHQYYDESIMIIPNLVYLESLRRKFNFKYYNIYTINDPIGRRPKLIIFDDCFSEDIIYHNPQAKIFRIYTP